MQQDVQGKVDSRAMREVNRSIVLDIIRRGGRVSRTDLARRSALTKPTVSAIVEDLLARGIVQEVGYGKTVASGGRRARLLEFNDASAAYLGICFGVNATTVGLADARGEIRVRREVPTLHGDAEAMVASAAALVEEVCEEAGFPRDRLQAVGVAIPGMVDAATGRVAMAPNLGWVEVPIRDMLVAKLGVPVVVTNITSAGAIAEGRVGAAKGVRSFVWAYVGTGVGAGIVIDGHVFSGTRGFSGEIGHCAVADGGPECACGMRGCLETLVSGRAIVRAAEVALASGKVTSLSALPAVHAAARWGFGRSRRLCRGRRVSRCRRVVSREHPRSPNGRTRRRRDGSLRSAARRHPRIPGAALAQGWARASRGQRARRRRGAHRLGVRCDGPIGALVPRRRDR
jgi:predicted NBD/HSP70 family sugar kinase